MFDTVKIITEVVQRDGQLKRSTTKNSITQATKCLKGGGWPEGHATVAAGLFLAAPTAKVVDATGQKPDKANVAVFASESP